MKYKTRTCLWSPDSFPWSSLLMMLPFSLLEGDDSFCINHHFPSFRFCVINHVSAPKTVLFVQCNMSNKNKKGTDSPIQCPLFSSVGFFVTQWMSSSLAMSAAEHVCMPCIICSGHAWCPGLSCHCWKPCIVSSCFHDVTHIPNTFTNWQWISTDATHITHKNQNTLHTSTHHAHKSKQLHTPKSATVPVNPTYLWYPLIAVQSHHLHVPITCLNLQSHDTISCQACSYLIFWNFLV